MKLVIQRATVAVFTLFALTACGTKTPIVVPPTTSTTAQAPVVTSGAFCSPIGARGVTSTGTPMRCIKNSGETRAKWRQS
jgi:predicted small lipoprotein YifL